MNSELVRKIKEAVKSFGLEKNIFYNFVEDKNIDKTKTYITYSQYSSTPNYQINIASTVFDISVFSNSLNRASTIKREIALHLAGVENESVILETNIEDEKELLDDSGLYQSIITIRILHRI